MERSTMHTSLAEMERKYAEARVVLIGFKTIYIDDQSRAEFNRFYFDNKEQFDAIDNHHYDPDTAQLRVYFPVQSAIVEMNGDRYEASDCGGLHLPRGVGPESMKVIGRRQTDRITGISTNIVKEGIIYLATPVPVDHIINKHVLVFDFGRREIGNPDHECHHGDDHAEIGARVSCIPNHGGVNCTTAFGVGQGRCPFNPAVCMDYNGYWTDCVNYGSGWKKYRNFVGSDCDIALGRGHCWNEIM